MLSNHGQGDVPAIINDDASLSLLFAYNGNKVNDIFMHDKRDGDWTDHQVQPGAPAVPVADRAARRGRTLNLAAGPPRGGCR